MISYAKELETIAENQLKLYDAGRNSVIDPDKIIEATATGNGFVPLTDVSEVKHQVEIKTAAGTNVKVYGKNLFDVNSVSYLALSSTDTSATRGYQENGILYAFQALYGSAAYWKGCILNLTPGVYTISCDAYTNMDDTETVGAKFIDVDTNERINPIDGSSRQITKGKKARFTWTMNVTEKRIYGLSLQGAGNSNNTDNLDVQFTNIQIEVSDFATLYEPYIEPREYTADPNGIVLVDSISPSMTIVSDVAEITAEYHKSWGMQAEYDAFWESLQGGGHSENYSCTFGAAWRVGSFRPKYDIIPSNAYMMFRGSAMEIDLVAHLDALGVTLDLSKATNTQYAFQSSMFTRLGIIDLSSSSNVTPMDNMFLGCTKLVTIDKLVLKTGTKGEFSANSFSSCGLLENLTLEGTITQNGLNLQWSPKLSHDSLMNIIDCLEDKSADTSGTEWVVTIGSANVAKLTDEELLIAKNKGWDVN